MQQSGGTFFGLTCRTTIVLSSGQEGQIPAEYSRGKHLRTHTMPNVYALMLWQVCREYSLDFRTLTMSQVRFFYRGLREELKRAGQAAAKAN